MPRDIRTASELLAGLATVGMVMAPVNAMPIENGGFETGNLAGWGSITSGQVPFDGLNNGVVNGLPHLGPPQGNYMAMITTPAWEVHNGVDFMWNGLPANANTEGATGVVPGVSLHFQHTLHFAAGIDSNGGRSLIWQTFSVAGPQQIQFDWNLLANDATGFASLFSDHGFVSVFEGTGPACPFPLSQLSPYCPPALALAGSHDATIGVPFESQPAITQSGTYFRQTGWNTATLALPTAGNYTVIFGVAQGVDPIAGTALLVDNVRVVPKPGSIALLDVALAGLGFSRRRKPRLSTSGLSASERFSPRARYVDPEPVPNSLVFRNVSHVKLMAMYTPGGKLHGQPFEADRVGGVGPS